MENNSVVVNLVQKHQVMITKLKMTIFKSQEKLRRKISITVKKTENLKINYYNILSTSDILDLKREVDWRLFMNPV